jgi:hypothetical protein
LKTFVDTKDLLHDMANPSPNLPTVSPFYAIDEEQKDTIIETLPISSRHTEVTPRVSNETTKREKWRDFLKGKTTSCPFHQSIPSYDRARKQHFVANLHEIHTFLGNQLHDFQVLETAAPFYTGLHQRIVSEDVTNARKEYLRIPRMSIEDLKRAPAPSKMIKSIEIAKDTVLKPVTGTEHLFNHLDNFRRKSTTVVQQFTNQKVEMGRRSRVKSLPNAPYYEKNQTVLSRMLKPLHTNSMLKLKSEKFMTYERFCRDNPIGTPESPRISFKHIKPKLPGYILESPSKRKSSGNSEHFFMTQYTEPASTPRAPGTPKLMEFEPVKTKNKKGQVKVFREHLNNLMGKCLDVQGEIKQGYKTLQKEEIIAQLQTMSNLKATMLKQNVLHSLDFTKRDRIQFDEQRVKNSYLRKHLDPQALRTILKADNIC